MSVKPDKYASDARQWENWAVNDYRGAKTLFQHGDPFLYFPAATLGHHALEKYLKAALIKNGMTVFDPKKVKSLDAGVKLAAQDCAWGHTLVELARVLAKRNPKFDPSKQLKPVGLVTLKEPMTVEEGLRIFDGFFSELRYPQELNKVSGLGPDEELLLDMLVYELKHLR